MIERFVSRGGWRGPLAMWAPPAAVTIPLVVAAVRAASGGWMPIGDHAWFTIRSRDVLTSHHPWVGARSSGSLMTDSGLNNPGPLQLDLLAPFTKLAPVGGTAFGVVVVHVAAILTIAWLIRRLAGVPAVLAAMVPLALLTWTMGSELMITPQQHQYLVLPLLCVLVAAWAVSSGDTWALVPLAVAASLTIQTHLSYAVVTAGACLAAVAGLVFWCRADPERRSTLRAPIVATAAVCTICWFQPVVDQFTGWNNLTAVFATSSESPSPGFGTGMGIVASVLTAPDTLVRSGYTNFQAPGSPDVLPVLGLVAGIAVAATLLALSVTTGRRRAAAGLGVALCTTVAAVINASLLPPLEIFELAALNYRWLWSLAAFLAIGLLVAIQQLSGRLAAARTSLTIALAVSVGAAAIANVPRSVQMNDSDTYLRDIDTAREMSRQVRQLDDSVIEGPVAIDATDMAFGHPFAEPVALALQERGVEFRFVGPHQSRRFGDDRIADGSEPVTFVLHAGAAATDAVESTEPVVWVDVHVPLAIIAESAEDSVSDAESSQ